MVTMRRSLPIGIVDAYWDDKGEALCPMATGVSHHIGPSAAIEPCPIIQFARESIHDGGSFYKAMTGSAFLNDFRQTTAQANARLHCPGTAGPGAQTWLTGTRRDTTQRGTAALKELEKLTPRTSQHLPGQEVPEEHWLYRFAKKHWFFGFGAYT